MEIGQSSHQGGSSVRMSPPPSVTSLLGLAGYAFILFIASRLVQITINKINA